MLRKSELKKIIILALIILIISIISIITINKIQYKKYTNMINNKIAEIISNVQEQADKEDIEIEDEGINLFTNLYEKNILKSNGIIIKRICN